MTKHTAHTFGYLILFFLYVGVVISLFFPEPTLAQTQSYELISPLGTQETVPLNQPENYIVNLFIVFIAIISVLAVIKLIICGFQYMTSEAVGSKGEAKNCMWAVFGGIFIILLSYIGLQIINPDLTSLRFIESFRAKGEQIKERGEFLATEEERRKERERQARFAGSQNVDGVIGATIVSSNSLYLPQKGSEQCEVTYGGGTRSHTVVFGGNLYGFTGRVSNAPPPSIAPNWPSSRPAVCSYRKQ